MSLEVRVHKNGDIKVTAFERFEIDPLGQDLLLFADYLEVLRVQLEVKLSDLVLESLDPIQLEDWLQHVFVHEVHWVLVLADLLVLHLTRWPRLLLLPSHLVKDVL